MPRRACWSYIDNNSRIRVKEAPGQCVQWELRARQSVRQRRDRFLKPHDVFNAARHRVDSSQSAACLVRAAFDPGERNGKENEERLQACWDWRYCRWSSITLKFRGYCVGFNFLNTKRKSAKASTLRRATIRHPHTPSSMCPINMLACEIPLTNTTRTLTLIPLQRSVRCQECFIINHTLCRRRCALHSAADVANWQ